MMQMLQLKANRRRKQVSSHQGVKSVAAEQLAGDGQVETIQYTCLYQGMHYRRPGYGIEAAVAVHGKLFYQSFALNPGSRACHEDINASCLQQPFALVIG